jgi:plastocyanin
MFRANLAACAGLIATLVTAAEAPALAHAVQASPQTLVIGVDHVDAANQSLSDHRWFEYTDFFARDVKLHQGDVLDFRFAPGNFGHAKALAPDQAVARQVYPLAIADTDDPASIATGQPKLLSGPGGFAITNGSTHGGGQIGTDPNGGDRACGVAPLPVCTFKGGDDIEAAGRVAGTDSVTDNPVTVDWQIQIDPTTPVGDYAFLCFFHPGMQGHFKVVDGNAPTSLQAAVDARANTQFEIDRAQASAAETSANVTHFKGGAPGTRTYAVSVGVSPPDNHASVLEMLPQHLDLVAGDRVRYSVNLSPNEAHSVSFPTDSPNLPGVAVFDCGASFEIIGSGPPCIEDGGPAPEVIFDPGTAASGSPLTSPAALLDSGILFGAGNTFQSGKLWSISTATATPAGTYQFQCQIHDVMQGSLTVRPRQ